MTLPMSRREVMRVGLFGLGGLLLGQGRVFGADAGEQSPQAKPVTAAPGVVKAKSVISSSVGAVRFAKAVHSARISSTAERMKTERFKLTLS